MDEIIEETYNTMLKVQEREINGIENRMDFANWLFGVASTLIITAIVAARTIASDDSAAIAPENLITLSVGVFAFIGIILTFIGKLQGYASLKNKSMVVTFLDIQKFAFLKDKPPTGTADEKFQNFSCFRYLPKEFAERYRLHETFDSRTYSEVLWLYLTSASVFISLGSLLLLLIELTI